MQVRIYQAVTCLAICHLGVTHGESTVTPVLLSLVLLSHAHVLVPQFKAFSYLLCAFNIYIYQFRSFDFILQDTFC